MLILGVRLGIRSSEELLEPLGLGFFLRNDFFRFMEAYSGKPLRETILEDSLFWMKVMIRARKLYLKKNRKLPSLLM